MTSWPHASRRRKVAVFDELRRQARMLALLTYYILARLTVE